MKNKISQWLSPVRDRFHGPPITPEQMEFDRNLHEFLAYVEKNKYAIAFDMTCDWLDRQAARHEENVPGHQGEFPQVPMQQKEMENVGGSAATILEAQERSHSVVEELQMRTERIREFASSHAIPQPPRGKDEPDIEPG